MSKRRCEPDDLFLFPFLLTERLTGFLFLILWFLAVYIPGL